MNDLIEIAREMGARAYLENLAPSDCPFTRDDVLRFDAWIVGWADEREFQDEREFSSKRELEDRGIEYV